MAVSRPSHRRPQPITFLQRIKAYAPDSAQLLGLFTLFLFASILIVLTGITATAAILGCIFFMPLILVSSPVWFPIGAVLFVSIAGFLSACSFGVVTVAGLSWTYRYVNGMHGAVRSDRVDQPGKRICDTSAEEKDQSAMECGHGVKMVA
ncbi:hypothetical protein like AT3G18570 [Hibiscus trionum]|uniref:Oleosin n=1 Tax=Hibiscus trionum TaxID=183268 RepID=A0A9W7JE74_HIBTR|nr:hypothetical protein like AT3G18570 [Hibiscus trionum]